MKMMSPSKTHLENHYADLKSKSFFPGLIKYMMMGPVVAMVWEGDNVVKTGRKMLGATNPRDSAPGTIRGDLCVDVGRNICHGSDSVEAAKKEIELWFPEGLNKYADHSEAWVYEKVEENAASDEVTKEAEEFDEWKCYDDDACLNKSMPSLDGLDFVQGAKPVFGKKPTVVLFWAKFLKWQVYPAMKGLEALYQKGDVNVVGIATDPKRSAVARHIEKGECPTTYPLCFDESDGSPGGKVKNAFKEVCDGFIQVPQVFLVSTEGKIVWRQPFSSARPYEQSNFEDQVAKFIAGKPLVKYGPAPKDEEDDEDDDDGNDETVDLVDPLAADVDW